MQAFDLVALQEIMDLESVEQLERELEAITGDPWESMASHLIGRSTYQEAYAFLWNETTMEHLHGAVVLFSQESPTQRAFEAPFPMMYLPSAISTFCMAIQLVIACLKLKFKQITGNGWGRSTQTDPGC